MRELWAKIVASKFGQRVKAIVHRDGLALLVLVGIPIGLLVYIPLGILWVDGWWTFCLLAKVGTRGDKVKVRDAIRDFGFPAVSLAVGNGILFTVLTHRIVSSWGL